MSEPAAIVIPADLLPSDGRFGSGPTRIRDAQLEALTAAGRTLLVDRGWVPFTGSRRRLPDITLAGGAALTLTGRAANLPSAGLSAGRAAPGASDPWPKVTSFPDTAQLASALGEPLEARILLLDAQARFGYARDWQPPGISPLRNFSYAIQWWCFAALAVIVANLLVDMTYSLIDPRIKKGGPET